MPDISWLSETEFTVAGVRFDCSPSDYSRRTDSNRLVILKDKGALEAYATVLGGEQPENALEFGVFQGGSPAFLTLWLGLKRFVGIDLSEPIPEFDDFCRTHPAGNRIRTYYQTSQADKGTIDAIVRDEFPPDSLDLIIDDASHHYDLSRRTFEIAFPHLKPGGYYVLEDWGWAHWPGSEFYRGETALSLLTMELLMLCASRKDLISEVRVFPSVVFVRKAPGAPELEDFRLDAAYSRRGIALSGARHLNLSGFGGLLKERAFRRLRRLVSRIAS